MDRVHDPYHVHHQKLSATGQGLHHVPCCSPTHLGPLELLVIMMKIRVIIIMKLIRLMVMVMVMVTSSDHPLACHPHHYDHIID